VDGAEGFPIAPSKIWSTTGDGKPLIDKRDGVGTRGRALSLGLNEALSRIGDQRWASAKTAGHERRVIKVATNQGGYGPPSVSASVPIRCRRFSGSAGPDQF